MVREKRDLRDTGRSGIVVVTVVAGSVAGLIVVAVMVSFASLVFSGPLAAYLPLGSALFLAAAAAMNLIAARLSSVPGSLLLPQDATSAILATTLAAALVGVSSSGLLSTALAVMAIATLVTGVVMLALGGMRMGNLVRFIPLPVIGGFLAGTGWLLVSGAADLLTGGFVWSGRTIGVLAGGAGLGLVLAVILRLRPGPWAFPALIIGSGVLFYLLLLVTGTTLEEARELGLLTSVTGMTLPLGISIGAVDWSAVAAAGPGVATVPLVATVALLLNVGGLELVAGKEADLDRELRTAGWGNLAVGTAASPAGYHVLSVSALPYRLGIHSRVIPLIVAGVSIAGILAGPTLVSLIPVPVVGGVLTMLGLSFLADWVLDGRSRMPRGEYLLMLAIVVAVALVGFLAGVLLGMVAAVVLFTVRYSRLDPIRHTFTADQRSSSLERAPSVRRSLEQVSGSVKVVEVQGFLFFGTAHRAVQSLKDDIDTGEVRCLIVDLRRVEGIDSTAMLAFVNLQRRAGEAGVHLVFSHASADVQEAMTSAGRTSFPDGIFAPDLDHALEVCESIVLPATADPCVEHFVPDRVWERIEPHLERIELGAGEVLAEMGEASDCVFIVESGRVAVELPVDAARWQRVRSVGPGNVIGEFSLYTGAVRSARLRAENPSTVFRLTPAAIVEIERADPEAAIVFHRAVGRVLVERLTASNDFVQALIR